MADFSKNIKRLRKERDISQNRIAELLKCSQGLISQYEKGLCKPKYRTLRRLSEVLGVSMEELYGDEENTVKNDVEYHRITNGGSESDAGTDSKKNQGQ